ncbi:MAG TPA: DnaJ C-terminal domain-containing protein, partial [Polyangia bacterium]
MLSDEEKRGHYDRFGAVDGAGPLGGADIASATEFFDALFGDLFGLARRRKTAGRDMRYTLEVDFEEAALGCEKTITFERPEDCRACLGTGAEGAGAGLVTCSRCGGEGIVRKKAGFLTTRRECMGCGGTGQVPRVRCAACEGAGLVDRERTYTVRIPPGSIAGSTQRLPREGAPGRRGGQAGDLHVLVRVRPHPFYGRESTREGE